jgi:hypothetical protein
MSAFMSSGQSSSTPPAEGIRGHLKFIPFALLILGDQAHRLRDLSLAQPLLDLPRGALPRVQRSSLAQNRSPSFLARVERADRFTVATVHREEVVNVLR